MKCSTGRFNNRFKTGRKRPREPKPPRAKQRDRMAENTDWKDTTGRLHTFIVLEEFRKITAKSSCPNMG